MTANWLLGAATHSVTPGPRPTAGELRRVGLRRPGSRAQDTESRRVSVRSVAWLVLAAVALVSASCGSATGRARSEVVVFAASSLTDAFVELGSRFEAEHPRIAVTFNFASSSTLATQILEGAPADVFAPADDAQMTTIVEAGLAAEPRYFATNHMVIVVPRDNPADLRRPQDLAAVGVKVVLAAPEVPAGGYARRILDRIGILEPVVDNVVSNEPDVKTVLTKVVLGEADAGVVYATDIGGGVAERVAAIEFPAGAEVTARYPIASLGGSAGHASSEFVSFVLSEEGRAVLRDYGFGAP